MGFDLHNGGIFLGCFAFDVSFSSHNGFKLWLNVDDFSFALVFMRFLAPRIECMGGISYGCLGKLSHPLSIS